VFVSGIPQDSQGVQGGLIQHFSKFGAVVDIKVNLDKGRAFVQFNSREHAEAALAAADAVLGNRFIRLHWANFDLQPDRAPQLNPHANPFSPTSPALPQGQSHLPQALALRH